MNRNNSGMITLNGQCLLKNLDLVAEAFAFLNFLPLYIETDFARDQIKYSGVATDFSEVTLGQMIPEYMIEINFEENQFKNARFVDAYFWRGHYSKHGIQDAPKNLSEDNLWRIGQ